MRMGIYLTCTCVWPCSNDNEVTVVTIDIWLRRLPIILEIVSPIYLSRLIVKDTYTQLLTLTLNLSI